MVHIIRQRDPLFEQELGRDFKPVAVIQGDFTIVIRWDGPNLVYADRNDPSIAGIVDEGNPLRQSVPDDGRVRMLQRWQRRVRFTSLDQSRECVLVTDLGEALGMDAIVVPCREGSDAVTADDSVDYSHAIELLDWAADRQRFYAQRRTAAEPLRTAAWLNALRERAEEILRARKGQSTFGYSGILGQTTGLVRS